MTKQESINRFIVEEVEGGCWHEADSYNTDECLKCKKAFQTQDYEPYCCEDDNPDFSQPKNFIRLLKIARENCDMEVLTVIADIIKTSLIYIGEISIDNIPSTLSELIAKSLGWKE